MKFSNKVTHVDSPNKTFCDKNNNYVLMINLLYNTIKEIKTKQQANDNT